MSENPGGRWRWGLVSGAVASGLVLLAWPAPCPVCGESPCQCDGGGGRPVVEIELAPGKVRQLTKADALVIDELGYLPMSRQARYALFQLINRFYEHRTLIITTNKNFTSWGEFFHDDNVAVPIIDRIIHHSHLYLLGGESYRLKQKTLSLRSWVGHF